MSLAPNTISRILEYITNETEELSHADYLEILEELKDDIETRIDGVQDDIARETREKIEAEEDQELEHKACPVPDERTEIRPDYDSRLSMQSMLDTIAAQRQEIEALKKSIALACSYLTVTQLESLRYMLQLLTEEKK